jgi:hypothetical protein
VVESEFLPDAGGRGVVGEVVVGFKTESAGDRGHNFTLKFGAPTGKRIVRTFRKETKGPAYLGNVVPLNKASTKIWVSKVDGVLSKAEPGR